jgi:uncharacterized protein YgiM (DUF1202 family)
MKSKFYLMTLITALTASAVVAQEQPRLQQLVDRSAAPEKTPALPVPAPATDVAQAAPAPAPAPDATQAAPAPAPETKPEAKPKTSTKKKKASTKSKSTKSTAKSDSSSGSGKVVYNPPASATVKQEFVNVRGQASFIGEVITHLKKGETVTVLEEITLKKPKKDEPAKWAKILMPTNTPVWVSGDYVDPATSTAKSRLNVRGGPGENYSVVARIEKGTPIKEIRKNKGWIEIETPANAVGFVAADFLNITPGTAPAVATNTPAPAPEATPAPAPAPEVANVTPDNAQPVAANPNEQPTPSAPSANPAEAVPTTPAAQTPPAEAAPAPEVSNEPPPKRVVTREGTVRKARNIQAPTDYELRDSHSGETIEYLLSATADKTLKPYLGMRVLVTGPEAVDMRWKATPIMEVEGIELP